ncbi:hypothetical protein BD413DRAFT_542458 [Trametes elegans]|nr:hypothetical protein BD413DRAFT_542458 [Trametes elegans]
MQQFPEGGMQVLVTCSGPMLLRLIAFALPSAQLKKKRNGRYLLSLRRCVSSMIRIQAFGKVHVVGPGTRSCRLNLLEYILRRPPSSRAASSWPYNCLSKLNLNAITHPRLRVRPGFDSVVSRSGTVNKHACDHTPWLRCTASRINRYTPKS